jgi:hypothetical protein
VSRFIGNLFSALTFDGVTMDVAFRPDGAILTYANAVDGAADDPIEITDLDKVTFGTMRAGRGIASSAGQSSAAFHTGPRSKAAAVIAAREAAGRTRSIDSLTQPLDEYLERKGCPEFAETVRSFHAAFNAVDQAA